MSPLRVFAYGSLIFAPEHPDALLAQQPARLSGYRRAFNKRSRARACPREESFDAFPGEHPQFVHEGMNFSLALGLELHAGGGVDGVVFSYADEHRDAVLRSTDRREGYDPQRERRMNGYLRKSATVQTPAGGTEAFIYLSNPDPDAYYRVSPELSAAQRARILINATPKALQEPLDSKARGLYYLEGVRRDLRGMGIVDTQLEAIAAAVHAHAGPWCALVAPPAV